MLILIMGTGGIEVLLYTYVYIMNVCVFVIHSISSLIAIAFHHRGRVKYAEIKKGEKRFPVKFRLKVRITQKIS